MNDERIEKIVLKGNVDGIERKGRTRTAWMSTVGSSLSRAKVPARDREKWRTILRFVIMLLKLKVTIIQKKKSKR